MIETKGLTKRFGDLTVFEDLNVEVKKGEVLVIIGPSGSGKSTFLRCLNTLELPDGGEVIIEGEAFNLKDKKDTRIKIEKMGMVFQHFNLFPHMTVLGNMTLAPKKLLKLSKEKAEETRRVRMQNAL